MISVALFHPTESHNVLAHSRNISGATKEGLFSDKRVVSNPHRSRTGLRSAQPQIPD